MSAATTTKGCHQVVRSAFASALKAAFPTIESEVVITPSNPKFGDYQCNSTMGIFKKYGKEWGVKTAKEIGEKIHQNLDMSLFASASVAPQGFVTIKLHTNWLQEQIKNIFENGFQLKADTKHKIAVDFSHPNIAKEMHVGHLRSTIIGESICRILEHMGHEVHRQNHLGDWGTQFGMLIEYLKQEYPDFEEHCPAISDLQNFYRNAKKRFDEDESFKKNAQLNVVLLQGGDPYAMNCWQQICEISRREFQKVYDRLHVRLEEKGESSYNYMLPSIVQELVDAGLAVESDGAKCFFVPNYKVPLMVVKSDGGYGYDTTDLAAIKYRLKDMKADWILYVVDLGQEEHFMKLFYAAQAAGWYSKDDKNIRVEYLGFGVVQGEDGKKFKTRSGDVVKLTELLDEAVDRAYQEIKRRKNDNGANEESPAGENEDELNFLKSDEDCRKAAECIGYSAIKYFELKQNRLSSYKFSYDKMLDPKGNTAVYMMYAYARICAIFRKAKVDAKQINKAELKIENDEERALCLAVLKLPEILHAILQDFFVNRLSEYMYNLTEIFTQFYQNHKIVNSPQQSSRLILCEITRYTLHLCFDLLGIEPLQQI